MALAALDGDGSVIRRKLARDLDPDLLPQLAALPEYRPRLQIQLAHVGPGVGQNERSFLRPLGGAVLCPCADQLLLRLAPVLAEVNRAVLLVAVERPLRLSAREVAGGLPLPRLALAADAGELLVPYPLGDRPKRRSRLDRLQLLGIADQHHLGAVLRSRGDDALQLAAADHPRLVDHQHVAALKPLVAFPPRLLP